MDLFILNLQKDDMTDVINQNNVNFKLDRFTAPLNFIVIIMAKRVFVI